MIDQGNKEIKEHEQMQEEERVRERRERDTDTVQGARGEKWA